MAELVVRPVRLKLRSPLKAAWGSLDERELLVVRLDFGGGDYGEGEAAPIEAYDRVSLSAVRAALDAYGSVLARASPRSTHAELLAACAAERPLPHALAAIDLALWDRAGRRTGFPVAQLIAAGAVRSVAVNATIRAADRAGAAEAAAQAAAAGFWCVKMKVGIGDDAGRVAAVRAAIGARAAIRIDANGAWTVDEAIAHLRHLAPSGIELAEEPVHGVEALRAVRAEVDVALAMDETAAEEGAPESGATHAVCLKIGRCGGISGVLRDAAAARLGGSTVYVASTYDGPVGIAGGVHAAAGLSASGILPAHGLATLDVFAEPGERLRAVRGAIRVPRDPGLGVE